MATRPLTDVAMLAEDLDHPEAVAWDPNGHVYAGGEAGQLYRIPAGGGEAVVHASTDGFVLGVCVDGAGGVVLCDLGRHDVLYVDAAGDVRPFTPATAEHHLVCPNFACFDAEHNLYVTDSGNWRAGDGRLFVIRPDGSCSVITTDLGQYPNGMALDAEGTHLYIALSTASCVVRLRVECGRAVGEAELWAELPGTVPDGLAFDASGALFVSCYTPDVIFRVSPGGAPEVFLEDPDRTTLASPTNVAFGGADLRTLYIANLCGWHVGRIETETPGLPLHCPPPGTLAVHR